MYLNIDESLKKELKKEAKQLGITLTGYIRMILMKREKWCQAKNIQKF